MAKLLYSHHLYQNAQALAHTHKQEEKKGVVISAYVCLYTYPKKNPINFDRNDKVSSSICHRFKSISDIYCFLVVL